MPSLSKVEPRLVGGMFSTRNIQRLAGILLVGTFAAFLAHFVAYGAGSDRTLIFCLLVYGFLTSLSGITLYQVFRPYCCKRSMLRRYSAQHTA